MPARLFPHLGLGHATQRKQRAAELVLSEPKQEVGLVLGEIGRTLQQPASAGVVVLDPRIVPGRQQVGADLARRNEELVKLQVIVAETTRNRRSARKILLDEWLHHIALETLFLIDHVVRDADCLRQDRKRTRMNS